MTFLQSVLCTTPELFRQNSSQSEDIQIYISAHELMWAPVPIAVNGRLANEINDFQLISQNLPTLNHRMVWAGRELKRLSSPTTLPWALFGLWLLFQKGTERRSCLPGLFRCYIYPRASPYINRWGPEYQLSVYVFDNQPPHNKWKQYS